MSADLCFTRDSFFLFSSFFRRLSCELAELNSTKIGHMVGSKCSLKTHVQNLGYPFPLQIRGPKTTILGWLHNLTATLTAICFWNETWHRQSVKCIDNYNGLLHRLKMSWTLVHKRLQTRPAFYPPSVNSAFCFIARLRRRRSANGTQPNFAK